VRGHGEHRTKAKKQTVSRREKQFTMCYPFHKRSRWELKRVDGLDSDENVDEAEQLAQALTIRPIQPPSPEQLLLAQKYNIPVEDHDDHFTLHHKILAAAVAYWNAIPPYLLEKARRYNIPVEDHDTWFTLGDKIAAHRNAITSDDIKIAQSLNITIEDQDNHDTIWKKIASAQKPRVRRHEESDYLQPRKRIRTDDSILTEDSDSDDEDDDVDDDDDSITDSNDDDDSISTEDSEEDYLSRYDERPLVLCSNAFFAHLL
jgi:hypothetical protein